MRGVPHEIESVLHAHKGRLLRRRNVTGCGIGFKEVRGEKTDTPALILFVNKKRPLSMLALEDRIPPEIAGVRTDVIEIGSVRLLSDRTRRVRPAYPGVSIGHYRISAGTFGAVVYDAETRSPLILSNNHVLANISSGKDGRASLGDPISQPGPYDGGSTDDTIGFLRRFVPIMTLRFPFGDGESQEVGGPINRVDAAVAEPITPDIITPEILGIGPVLGVADVVAGQRVRKSGRTTGVTEGRVRALSATLNVSMGDAGIAMFEDQIVTSPMAEPGDSGSAGITEEGYIFGLLFAGSAQATIFNRAQNIMELLRVDFVP